MRPRLGLVVGDQESEQPELLSAPFVAIRFLKQFGFEEDPFASTNAADEPNLADYFVEPPYFASVMGDRGDPSRTSFWLHAEEDGTAQNDRSRERLAEHPLRDI
jgi:hypothetical protein